MSNMLYMLDIPSLTKVSTQVITCCFYEMDKGQGDCQGRYVQHSRKEITVLSEPKCSKVIKKTTN